MSLPLQASLTQLEEMSGNAVVTENCEDVLDLMGSEDDEADEAGAWIEAGEDADDETALREFELLDPIALFNEIVPEVHDKLVGMGIIPEEATLFRTFVSDLEETDLVPLLSCFEDPKDEAERAYLKLLAVSALLRDHTLQSRAKRLQTDFFRVPKVRRQTAEDRSGMVILPKPKVRPSPTLVTIAKAKSRLAAAKSEQDPVARATREEVERARQAKIILAYFLEAQVPSVLTAQASLDPERALLGCLGSARTSTLRKHERAWRRLRFWTQLNYATAWPDKPACVVDFLWSLYDGSCKKTLPQTTLDSVTFMETRADIPDEAKISSHSMVIGCVKHLTELLAKGAPPVRKAPMFLVSILAAWEFFIMDEAKTPYARALAWFVSVMLWTSMRFDDTVGLLPAKLKLLENGLEGLIVRSKSTGPGRKVNELRIFVSREATITGSEWLATGFAIWQEESFSFRRDYFLPLPSRNLNGCVKAEARYTDAAALVRALLVELPLVTFAAGKWRKCEGSLLTSAEAATFWRLHGIRNFVKSAALAAGETSDRTNYLGRWKAEASDEYVRTSRQIIHEVQDKVAHKLATAPWFLDESGTLQDLASCLQEAGYVDAFVGTQLLSLKVQRQGFDAAAPFNAFGPMPLENVQPEASEDRVEPKAMAEPATSDEEPLDPLTMEDYWISEDKRGGKLHITGGCPHFPGRNVKAYSWVSSPEAVKWTSYCKKCWKDVPPSENAAAQSRQSFESSSSSGSSSSSSSAPEAEAVL